jgi:hypothetical protein
MMSEDPSNLQPQHGLGNGERTGVSSTTQNGLVKSVDAAAPVQAGAGEVEDQAGEQASSLIGQVKDKAFAAASDGKDGLADTIDSLAQSVHKSSEQFAGQQDWIASAIERGAAELGTLATALRDNDLATLLEQAQSFARRQPAVFVGACLAGGFALARLGKLVAADASAADLPKLPEVGHGNG